MGTVVLFPQDCLPNLESRQRRTFSDAPYEMWMPSHGSSQLFDSPIFHPYHGGGNFHTLRNMNGPLYPYGAMNIFGLHPLQRDLERRQLKMKKPGDLKERDTSQRTKTSPSFSGFSPKEWRTDIKGRGPKPSKTPKNVLPDWKKNMGSNLQNFSNSTSSNIQKCNSGLHLQGSVASMPVDGVLGEESKEEFLGEEKFFLGKQTKELRHTPANVLRGFTVRPRRSCDDNLMPSKEPTQVLAREVRTEQKHDSLHAFGNISPNMASGNQSSRVNELENGPTMLRRALTDSQLVEHIGHYQSEVLQIPGSNPHAIARTTSMPIPERWAGPAYSTSPAPSSLPLPKFSCLGQKTTLRCPPSTVEQQKSKSTYPDKMGLAAKASQHLVGAEKLNVAFATMSLRRMLKLDLP